MREKPVCRIALIAITLLILGAVSTAASGASGPPLSAGDLFRPAPAPEGCATVESRGPQVVRSRYATVSPGLSEQTLLITLNLFEDVSLTALRDRVEGRGNGQYTWFGNLLGIEYGQVILVADRGGIMGHVAFPGGIFQIRDLGNGVHQVYQVDQSKFPREAEPVRADRAGARPRLAQEGPARDDGTTIDVLVVYTPAAASQSSNILSEIQLAVAETNQSYANSGITQRVRLAHAQQVSYTESGSFCDGSSSDLERLQNPYDGYLDDVPPMRDQYCADETVLIVETGDACGCAFYSSSPDPSFEDKAYAVVMRSCATGYYSFGHEMGHNMGAAHDWYVTGSDPSSSYNHGYINKSGRWRTVMAYNNDCTDSGYDCTRIQYWSNPSLTYQGAALGVPQGSYHAADNHTTLNSTAHVVANWRNSTSCSGPGQGVRLTWSAPASGGLNPPTNLQASLSAAAPEATVNEQEPNGCIGLVGGSDPYQTLSGGDTLYGSVSASDTGGCLHFTNSGDNFEDLFALTVPSSATYSFTLAWPGSPDLDLLLFNTSYQLQNPYCGNDRCGYTCSNPESFSVALSPGTYILAVNLATEGYCTGHPPSAANYTLNITGGSSGYTLVGYDVYRASVDSDSAYSKLNGSTIGAGTTNYTDSSPLQGANYYRARAVYNQGTSTWSNTASVNTNPVDPPNVTSMTKMGNPFRFVANGSNLQSGIEVYINGTQWTNVAWVNSGQIKIKGGSALKALVPKGVPTAFRFVNPDGGSQTGTWSW